MTQLLVRDLEVSTVNSLKKLAKSHDRSLQAEIKRILERAANKARYNPDKMAAQIRKRCGEVTQSDSVKLLAKDRQR